jgi:hypothetical protein
MIQASTYRFVVLVLLKAEIYKIRPRHGLVGWKYDHADIIENRLKDSEENDYHLLC